MSVVTRLAFAFALVIAMVTGATAPSFAATATPTEVVKTFCAKLVETMKQGEQLGFAGREKKMAPAIQAAFDLPAMTRMAVGPNWIKATPAEQQALISAFSDFSVATYASRFAAYNGEQFNMLNEKTSSSGDVIVETSLKPKEGDAVALNYLMRADDKGNWHIVDVFMNGAISELATRRAEFSSIVKRDGISALVNSLGDKAKQMGPS